MDVKAATALVEHIAGCCGGFWSPESKEAWTEAMLGVQDARHAEDAARTLAVRWQGKDRPSFHDFMQLYDTSKRQEMMRKGLPRPAHEKMALLDYLLGLAVKAEDGDKAARVELESWRITLAPAAARAGGIPRLGNTQRPKLIAALPGVEEAGEWFASNPDPLFE